VKIEYDQILAVLTAEVIKRDVLEGEKAIEAKKKIAKTAASALKAAVKKAATGPTTVAALGTGGIGNNPTPLDS